MPTSWVQKSVVRKVSVEHATTTEATEADIAATSSQSASFGTTPLATAVKVEPKTEEERELELVYN